MGLVDPVDLCERTTGERARPVGHHKQRSQRRACRIVFGGTEYEGAPDSLALQETELQEVARLSFRPEEGPEPVLSHGAVQQSPNENRTMSAWLSDVRT